MPATLPFWLRLLLAAALSLAGLAVAAAPQRVTQVMATLTPDGGPPQTLEITLPHRWDDSFPGRGGRASYQFELPATPDPSPRALYLPRAGNQIEVWLNDRLIHRVGRLGDQRTDAAKAPHWIPLPEVAHASGQPAARVQVRLSAQAARWGGLSAPWVGPRDKLYARYREHYRLRQYGGLIVCAVLGLMALMAAGFWWVQRDRLYLIFCLASAAGVLRIADRLIEHPPLPWPVWGLVTAWAMVALMVLMVYFALMLVHRQSLLDAPWFRLLVGLDLLLTAAAYVLGLPQLWTLTLTSLVVPAILSWIAMAQAAWRQRSGQALAVFVAGSALIGTGVRDWWNVRLYGDGAGTVSFMPHALLLFALLMGAVLVQRFARVAGERRTLLTTLEARVRQREVELNQRHAELRQEYAHQAALQERQRLMRDIHDGVGVQLVGLLDLLDHEATPRELLRQQLGTALDELRMAVDALQPTHGDLTTVLATLRYRLQPRLQAAGIAIDWQVDELPPIEGLTPTVVLQLQRVLQEAFTNALRHARASRLWVRAWLDHGPPARLVLSVEDDGRGLPDDGGATAPAGGQGLSSMQARAQAIGAELNVGPGAHGGTLVRLALPAGGAVGAPP